MRASSRPNLPLRRSSVRAARNLFRPASIVASLSLLAATMLAAPGALFAKHPLSLDGKPTVAVMYFNNGALLQHDEYEPLSKGIADVLITELASNDSIRVVERDQLQKLLEEQDLNATDRVDKAAAVKVGKLLGAQHMIFGGFVIDMKGRMRLDARAVNVETSEIEYVSTVSDDADNVLAVIAKLAAQLNDGMKLPAMPGGALPARSEKTNPAALKSLILYARAVGAQDAKDAGQAATLYQQFLDTSPSTILVAQRENAQSKLRLLREGGS